MENNAKKFDTEKDPWQLLPWDAVRSVVKVLDFGAKKYGERNWELGMDYDRLFRAAIEHLTQWFQHGEPDQETGCSHLWHAGCCILFLIAYELRGIGRDNRPFKKPQPAFKPSSPHKLGGGMTKDPETGLKIWKEDAGENR